MEEKSYLYRDCGQLSCVAGVVLYLLVADAKFFILCIVLVSESSCILTAVSNF